MKKISIFLTAVLLIAGIMTTSTAAYAAEGRNASVTAVAADAYHKEQELIEAKKLAAKLEGQSVKIAAQIGADGNFFGSVTSKEIANAI